MGPIYSFVYTRSILALFNHGVPGPDLKGWGAMFEPKSNFGCFHKALWAGTCGLNIFVFIPLANELVYLLIQGKPDYKRFYLPDL